MPSGSCATDDCAGVPASGPDSTPTGSEPVEATETTTGTCEGATGGCTLPATGSGWLGWLVVIGAGLAGAGLAARHIARRRV